MSSNKPPRNGLKQRMVEEAQLLAEEKWIIDTLKKIKAQRNALQIERLSLESMKAKILANASKNQSEAGTSAQADSTDLELPDILVTEQIDPFSNNINDVEENDQCNLEELNLTVTNSIFKTGLYGACDEEEEDEDMDNCVVDIDLLMSGK